MSHGYASDDTRRLDPAGLAVALAINGAVLAALFTAAPELIKVPPTIIKLIPVTEDPPPPPLPEPPKARPERVTAEPSPTAPDRIVDTLPPRETVTLSRDPVIVLPPAGPGRLAEDPVVLDPPSPPKPAALVAATPDPRYLDRFQPDYPPAKQRMGEEGSVRVRFLIGADGRVKAIEPVGAVDEAFFAATRRQALSQWRFRPATRGGEAVESWQTRTIRFIINE